MTTTEIVSAATSEKEPVDEFDSSNENENKSSDPEVQLRKRQRLKAKFTYLHGRLNGKPDMIRYNI